MSGLIVIGYPDETTQRAEQARLGGKPRLSEQLREVPEPPVEQELDR